MISNKNLLIHNITSAWITGFRLWHRDHGKQQYETGNSYLRALRHVFTHSENTGQRAS